MWVLLDPATQLPFVRVASNSPAGVAYRDLGFAKSVQMRAHTFTTALTDLPALGPSFLVASVGFDPTQPLLDAKSRRRPMTLTELAELSLIFKSALIASTPGADDTTSTVDLLAAAPTTGSAAMVIAPCVCGAGAVGLAGPSPDRHYSSYIRQDIYPWISSNPPRI